MTTSLSNLAYEHIRRKLLGGGFAGGAMLSETRLAREIGISRTPVREALAQLEREGVLDQIPRFGTFVRLLDREEVRELYDFRIELEGFAFAQAAARAEGALGEELRGMCGEMMGMLREAHRLGGAALPEELLQRWRLADAAFHTRVIRAAGNRWVVKVADDLRLMVHIFGGYREMPGSNPLATWVQTWCDHRRLARAVTRGDAEAARRIIVSHIRRGRQQALAYHDWLERQRGSAEVSQAVREHLEKLQRYAMISSQQVRERERPGG